ncbi:hypothetical protein ACGFYO_27725 [Streptomyces sp. NPDC048201]|uniref:hypothetical protein n=1 Tax=Streptomyces sp. NPDC048201 TaxID=3365513 RepID=UPI00371CC45D
MPVTPDPEAEYLSYWHDVPPYGLTIVGVPTDRLDEAEEKALSALAGLVLPPAWQEAEPELRRRVVAGCRPVPTTRMWHVTSEQPDTSPVRARHDCLRLLADEWPDAEPFADPDRWPGLTALVRLTALVCRMPPEIWLDAEEDLLDIYDRYVVGLL